MKYYFEAFRKIFDFNGQATINQFWTFFFINIVASTVILIISKLVLKTELPATIYRYFSILPLLAIGFRRMIDAGYSRWLFLIPIVNLVFAMLPSKEK